MFSKLKLWPSLIVALGVTSGETVSRGANLDPKTFVVEYRAALAKLQDTYKSVQVDGKATTARYRAGQTAPWKQDQHEMFYASTNGCEKLTLIGANPPIHRVILIGSCRNFSISKNPDTGKYALDLLGDLPQSYINAVDRQRNFNVQSALFADGYLPEIVATPAFKIKHLEEVSSDGQGLIRVEFTRGPVNPQSDPDTLQGWLMVDPKLSLSLKSYEVHRSAPKTVGKEQITSGEVVYGTSVDGVALPLRVTTDIQDFNGGKRELRFSTDRASFATTDSSVFSLDHYGLGDVDRPIGSRDNFLPYWALGIAATAAIGSILFRQIGGRSKQNGAKS